MTVPMASGMSYPSILHQLQATVRLGFAPPTMPFYSPGQRKELERLRKRGSHMNGSRILVEES